MWTAAEIVFPVFALIAAGYAFARFGLISRDGVRGLTAFIFYLAIPSLLFRSLAKSDPREFDLQLLATYYAGCLLIYLAGIVIGRKLFRLPLAESAIFAMAGTFSNTVLLGIPLILGAFGEAGLVHLLMIIAIHTASLIPPTTVLILMGQHREGEEGSAVARALIATFRNPLIMAILAGIGWALLRWPMPRMIGSTLDLVSSAAAPGAPFCLGASLAAYRLNAAWGETMAMVALKLVALPLVVFGLARYGLHLGPLPTGVATVCAAMPAGANVYILAQVHDVYVARTTATILVSTLLSVFTIALVLALF